MSSAAFHNALKTFLQFTESVHQFPDGGQKMIFQCKHGGNMQCSRECVIGRLTHVYIVIGMQFYAFIRTHTRIFTDRQHTRIFTNGRRNRIFTGMIFPVDGVKKLCGADGYHFIHIHIGLCAGAGLPNG